MAVQSPHSSRSSLRRKSLFPSEKMESDDSDVGYMSPLNSSTANSSDSDEHHQAITIPLARNKLDDYIIYDNKYVDANCAVIQAKSTPKMCRVPCASETMSPLLLSPLQSLISSPILYSPNTDGIVPMRTTMEQSPSEKMKTPHDTSTATNKAPKLIRKSLIDTSQTMDDDISEILLDSLTDSTLNKSVKLDNSLNKSKVRTALFPECDIADISVSVKSFYPKDNKYERSVCEPIVINKKVKQKQAPTYLCNRRRNAGQINAGVKHKIKKPKNKKLSHDKLLKAAMEIIKNSPLNEYLNSLDKENNYRTNVNKPNINVAEKVGKFAQEFGERQICPIKIQDTNLRDEQNSSLLDEQNTSLLSEHNTSLLNEQMEQERFELVEEKGPRKRTCSPEIENKKFFRSSRSRGVITVNENIKIGVDNGQFELLSGPKTKRRKIVFDQDTNELENIASSSVAAILNTLDSTATVTNPIRELTAEEKANILLSPTSQMCDMASGLAINSPKRAKVNITTVLTPTDKAAKMFPIFNEVSTSKIAKKVTAVRAKRFRATSPSQMLLDAGQKRFGLTQCPECQCVYDMGDPGEELMHKNYHSAGNILRFNGWKNEHVVAEKIDSRIIRVTMYDSKVWWKKIKDIMVIVNRDLGNYEMDMDMDKAIVYLYIRQRCIRGCLVAEPKQYAHRLLPALLDGNTGTAADNIDLCSEELFPVRCGVARVWTHRQDRRAGVATALMDALRTNFVYGDILRLEDMAFSCPTIAGKQFASRYFGTQNFLIYT